VNQEFKVCDVRKNVNIRDGVAREAKLFKGFNPIAE
jgi:hypothetical protein